MTLTSLVAVAAPQVTVRRIAHFTDTYLPRRDGVVTSLQTLCAALDTEATLTVVPRHGDQVKEPLDGFLSPNFITWLPLSALGDYLGAVPVDDLQYAVRTVIATIS